LLRIERFVAVRVEEARFLHDLAAVLETAT
jgi:hypothetical protein